MRAREFELKKATGLRGAVEGVVRFQMDWIGCLLNQPSSHIELHSCSLSGWVVAAIVVGVNIYLRFFSFKNP